MSNLDTVVLADDYATVRSAAERFVEELHATINREGIELPSLPEIALRIRRALADNSIEVDGLTHLIGSDPAFLAAQYFNQPLKNIYRFVYCLIGKEYLFTDLLIY